MLSYNKNELNYVHEIRSRMVAEAKKFFKLIQLLRQSFIQNSRNFQLIFITTYWRHGSCLRARKKDSQITFNGFTLIFSHKYVHIFMN